MSILKYFSKSNPNNSSDGSLALRRAYLFLIAYLCVSALCVFGFAQFFPKQWFWYAWGVSSSTAAVFLWKWFLKREGSISPNRLLTPTKKTISRFVAGLAIGSFIILTVTILLIYLLPLRLVLVDDIHILPTLGWSIALVFCAFQEEVGFRSYFLQKLQTVKGTWITQLTIAILFAVYHIVGGQDILTAMLSTGLWSVVFGLAAVYSRGLALPTGIHAASTIAQALLSMKTNDGFMGIFLLQPTRNMPDNVTAVVLIAQSMVLLTTIIILCIKLTGRRGTSDIKYRDLKAV